MKKTLFLSAILGAVFIASPALATDHTLSKDDSTAITLGNGDQIIIANEANDSRIRSLTYDNNITLNNATAKIHTSEWQGRVAVLNGQLNGTGTLEMGAWTGNDFCTDYVLTNNQSAFSGTLKLVKYDGQNNAVSQLVLNGTGTALQNADVEFGSASHILLVQQSATIGALKGNGKVESTSTKNTLTLNVTTDQTFSGSIGSGTYNDWANYGTSDNSQKNNTATSTVLNLTKTGTATQTLSGSVTLGTLAVENGTLVLSGSSTAVSSASVSTGAKLQASTAAFSGISSISGNGSILIVGNGNNGGDSLKLDQTGSGTIEIQKVKGTLAEQGAINHDIKLTTADNLAAMDISSFGGTEYTFNGAIKGFSNMALGIGAGNTVTFNLNGSLAEWTSGSQNYEGFRVTSGTANVVIGGTQSGDAAEVANAFSQNGGKINLTVNRDASFTNKVEADKLSVAEGKSATFKPADLLTVNEMTLASGSTVTLGSAEEDGHNYTLALQNLIVNGDATINANLKMDSGTITFADNAILTMGCDVTLGNDVVISLSETQYEKLSTLPAGETITLFTGVDNFNFTPSTITVTDGTNQGLFLVNYNADAKTVSIVPEPATATLSLLALAGLAARRRRK